MLSKILEFYAAHGRSLSGEGIKEAVISVDDSEYVLDLFLESRLLITGGDIYRQTVAGRFEPTYENWHYDGRSVSQSISEAKAYLDCIKARDSYVSFVFVS